MAKVQCSATWFLVATGFLEDVTQQHPQPKNLPNTRFHVSGKLQLFQLSTLRRGHSSLIWPFAKRETVKRMVLSQWSLLDTCMYALCSLLVIDVNWIAARMSYPLATLERHWTRASAGSSGMLPFLQYWWSTWTGLLHESPINWQHWKDIELGQVVGCSALSCWELERATWFLVAGSKRIPASLSHSSISN